ncbi:DUF4190 domain-containing protein [Longispora albida]|uniref:DUF4190 domain-containing protein n=1 Tax=Longispora albida TaxID=203523 RepID=UPI00037569AC|nr:DUF4190 domain-containing protein [Longispora albida]
MSYQPYGPPPARYNTMAIASLVTSAISVILTCVTGVGGLLGIAGAIMGHVAQRQIRQRNEQGEGLALSGAIIGWVIFVISAVILLLFGTLILKFWTEWDQMQDEMDNMGDHPDW